jgi:hypothetical protein
MLVRRLVVSLWLELLSSWFAVWGARIKKKQLPNTPGSDKGVIVKRAPLPKAAEHHRPPLPHVPHAKSSDSAKVAPMPAIEVEERAAPVARIKTSRSFLPTSSGDVEQANVVDDERAPVDVAPPKKLLLPESDSEEEKPKPSSNSSLPRQKTAAAVKQPTVAGKLQVPDSDEEYSAEHPAPAPVAAALSPKPTVTGKLQLPDSDDEYSAEHRSSAPVTNQAARSPTVTGKLQLPDSDDEYDDIVNAALSKITPKAVASPAKAPTVTGKLQLPDSDDEQYTPEQSPKAGLIRGKTGKVPPAATSPKASPVASQPSQQPRKLLQIVDDDSD